jgi:hypothetical protein
MKEGVRVKLIKPLQGFLSNVNTTELVVGDCGEVRYNVGRSLSGGEDTVGIRWDKKISCGHDGGSYTTPDPTRQVWEVPVATLEVIVGIQDDIDTTKAVRRIKIRR